MLESGEISRGLVVPLVAEALLGKHLSGNMTHSTSHVKGLRTGLQHVECHVASDLLHLTMVYCRLPLHAVLPHVDKGHNLPFT